MTKEEFSEIKHIETIEIVLNVSVTSHETPMLSEDGLILYCKLRDLSQSEVKNYFSRTDKHFIQVIKQLGTKIASAHNRSLIVVTVPKDFYGVEDCLGNGIESVYFSFDKDMQKMRKILDININDVTDSMKIESFKNMFRVQDLIRKYWTQICKSAPSIS